MKRRLFSDQELFEIRNHIPIKAVIEDILRIPSKISHGIFRFCCPLCADFNTAINPNKNLARCFYCKKNFNPIDMVIDVEKKGFVDTVNFLKKYKLNYRDKAKNNNPSQNSSSLTKMDSASATPKLCRDPVAIGQIISGFIREQPNSLEPDQFEQSSTPLPNQIKKIEQDILLLAQQIQQLKTIIRTQSK